MAQANVENPWLKLILVAFVTQSHRRRRQNVKVLAIVQTVKRVLMATAFHWSSIYLLGNLFNAQDYTNKTS